MDLGYFKHDGHRLLLWIAGPIIIALVIHFGATTYHDFQHDALEEYRVLVKLVPKLEHALTRATASSEVFVPVKGLGELTADNLNAHISDTAQKCDVLINSFSVASITENDRKAFSVVVKSEGPLHCIGRFFNTLQDPHSLLKIEAAHMSADRVDLNPPYSGEFKLKFYTRKSS